MSATLVVEPVHGGWKVVNADDFRNSMWNLIDGSFIAAPDEGSDATDDKVLDDFAESIGASGWMTTQEVAADMKNAYVDKRFPYYGDDYYLGQWDESDEVDYYGNDLAYFMWGESGKRDNSFEVEITCDPDMVDETGGGYGYTIYSGHMVENASGYRPEWDIEDAMAAAEKWCETNRDSLSPVERESSKKDKVGNMKHRSARKIAHYFDFWGESVNPDGTYEIFWGENGEMNNSIDLIAKEDDDADTLYCTVIGPDGSKLDNFTESNWGDAKDEFDRQCTIDHKYEGLLYNDQDPFDTPKGVNEFASTSTASKKTADAFTCWLSPDGDYYYGIQGDEGRSVQLNVIYGDEEEGILPYAEIIAPDGSIVGETTFDGYQLRDNEIKNWFEDYCRYNVYMPDLIDMTGIDTASVKTSMDGDSNGYSFWGDTVDNGSGDYEVFYGENGEENNSVMLYGTPDADGVDCVVVAPDGSTLDSFTADTWDGAKDRFDTDCRINHMYDDYIVDPQNPYSNTMASVKTSMDGSVWGEESFEDGCSFYYGPDGDLDDSFNVIVDAVDNTYECKIYGEDGDLLFDDGFSTIDEAKDAAVTWCQSFNGTTASVKTSAEFKFWDKDDSDPSFITGQYGVPGDYMNSRQWNAIQTDDGKWDVSVVGDDGFPQEVGLYKTISEAGSALLRYCNENYGRSASIASVKTSMDGDGFSFWGEMKIDNPMLDNAYQMFYGEPENKNNSLKCQAWQSNDPNDNYESECVIKAPDFNTLDSTVLYSWKECKQWFKDYCRDNAVFIDGILQASSKPEGF